MNIQAEKIELMKMILETDNPSILNSIKRILNIEKKKDFWDTLPANQKEEILKAIEEINSDEIIDYKDFIKKHK
ncbi:MAG TPA: hypothetical protein DDX39_01680 [Bacteroidales bacterium]|nr:MAG: hypothetical protein A2W98_07895 [Bacteroidetes bacterium GWF2_33_38]OFY72881.1 MAG: hypothetical protein A2265_01640 [Bacteroidetes bacterium RIFOXYA12_FULL_33_9]HBF87322.1 hypothetical protein [Bacteroidales bacterium]